MPRTASTGPTRKSSTRRCSSSWPQIEGMSEAGRARVMKARGGLARDVVIYGAAIGILVLVINLTEYRFLVVEHSVEVYAGLIAILAAGTGIWLGRSLRRKASASVSAPGPAPAAAPPSEPFVPDPARLGELGITPRELEILDLI